MTNEGRDSKVSCRYCQSKFIDSTELSKHVDGVHIGVGLLEGDTRKYWRIYLQQVRGSNSNSGYAYVTSVC